MNKLSQLKNTLQAEGLDALLIAKPTNRRYLSGFTGTSGMLLITPEANLLLTDFRYKDQAVQQAPEFQIVIHSFPLVKTLQELVTKYEVKKLGLEKDFITIAVYQELHENLPGVDLVPVKDFCAELRYIKTPEEITYMKKAVEIADKAFLHIMDFIRVGLSEKEIALELEFFMRRLGSEKNAFDIIAASGVRSALPHGIATNKTIAPGELVTLDFGAVYNGYHSDMTRTVVMGEPDARQREIYDLVLRAQEEVYKVIRPGMKAREADAVARDIISKAGYGENFGHGLGHGVGLEIHEGPRLAPSDETILEPGMVVSVEPGIYLSGWGGVRIEDLVVITPDGCDILTKSPKNIFLMKK
ncbi:MAG: Xaa-Pro dipeptidase [Peptococcaceae bacterium]|nr:Xaa-Pro dipeptidase [Peptococcaceae bacterium]